MSSKRISYPPEYRQQIVELYRAGRKFSELAREFEPSEQSRVVRNRDLHLEQLGQGTEEALGLPERKVEDQADRQSCLNGDVRVGALATGFATGRSSPGVQCSVGKPDGQVASSL